MPVSTLSADGRLTVPREIRQAVKATPDLPTTRMEMNHRILVPREICEATGARLGTRFIWEMQEDGSIRVIAKCRRPPWAEPLEAEIEAADGADPGGCSRTPVIACGPM